jgi:hypothetical protein
MILIGRALDLAIALREIAHGLYLMAYETACRIVICKARLA